MSTDNHTAVSSGAVANASTINTPLASLDAAIGDLTTMSTTPKTSVAGAVGAVALTTTAKTLTGAIAELDGEVAGLLGGTSASSQQLKDWTAAGSFEIVEDPIIYDATYPYLLSDDSSNTVTWPDGSAGEFTVTDIDTTWVVISGFTISHTDSGQTVTQTAITRDGTTGNVTTKPALTVA